MKKRSRKMLPKLAGARRELASKFIAEEMGTGKYPRKQAVAIGISRARKGKSTKLVHRLSEK